MPQLQARTCALVLVLLCITSVQGSSELLHGTWDAITLVPGRGTVPPNYQLTVEPEKWTVRERYAGRFSRFLDYAAERVGLVYASVPSDEHALCHMPSALTLMLAAARSDDGMRVECQTVWFTSSSLSSLGKDGLLHRRFDPAEQLYSADMGGCLPTPWRVREFYVAKMADDVFVFTGALVNNVSDTKGSCNVHLELKRRPIVPARESSPASMYAPIMMLLVVVAMRLLPRYVLTRRGQLDKASYRHKNPASLTPAQRLQLLRQQREIIEKMKAEDRADTSNRIGA
ncbi:hypothetical protein LSCM1_00017 [Leishmania martiniquensis]|uniref:Uncharacterized protein n=1 Tax=Leishmania martiniquensis TaxID=1580590 RepID=A0A836FY23_9TRYP|nr:hypothetical protein LSCM1_00017 [Leishmania martiniquensis]